jgi:hypothetical protein
MAAKIDTTNRFGVGVNGALIVVIRGGLTLSRDDALNLAAWLVALADEGEFGPLLEAVRRS